MASYAIRSYSWNENRLSALGVAFFLVPSGSENLIFIKLLESFLGPWLTGKPGVTVPFVISWGNKKVIFFGCID
jgi:hypothetical protein